MDSDCKKPLRIVITDFYKLHKNKCKAWQSNNSRNLVITRLQSIDGWKRLNKMGIVIENIVIKMFDHLFVRMSSYGKSKWVTMPSENLKWINLYVYLARKLDINAFS